MQKQEKKTKILIAISPLLLEEIDLLAREENRTRSNFIETTMLKKLADASKQ